MSSLTVYPFLMASAGHYVTKNAPLGASLFERIEGLGATCHEAVLAQDRLATFLNRTGLERNLALCTTLGTHCIVHLAIRPVGLAVRTASLATLWSAQVLACVEFLLTIGERECCAAVATGDRLISHRDKKKESK